MKKIVLLAAIAALTFPAAAVAQSGTAAGIAGGAATGAVLGGPVGAVVGGAAGAVIGTTVSPPPAPVRTYVVQNPRTSVTYEGEVVVGKPIPQTVTLYPVPDYEVYEYAVVNGRTVIVDPKTRVIVDVVE
jgi:hypothetical protein